MTQGLHMQGRRTKTVSTAGRGRSAVAGLVVAAVVASAGVVGIPSDPVAAAEADLTTSIPLGVHFARALAVDDGTGRVFLAADDVVLVRAADGTAIDAIDGLDAPSALLVALGAVWILDQGSASIVRIDPATLEVTGTWVVDEATDLVGLAVADGSVWTSGVTDGGTVLVELDPGTGSVATHATPEGTDTMLLAGSSAVPDLLVAGETSDGASAFVFDVGGDGAPTVEASRTFYGSVTDLAISSDGEVVTIAAGWADDYAMADLEATDEVSYNPPHTAQAVDRREVGDADTIAVAGQEVRGDPEIAVYRAGVPEHPVVHRGYWASYPVSGGVGLAPDGETLYVLEAGGWGGEGSSEIEAELLVLDLVPQADVVSPRVVGTDGGGVVTVEGQELETATISVAGQPTTLEDSSPTTPRFVVPALPAGEATVVLSRLGLEVTLDTPVVVRDLGPFRDSTHFVDRQEDDFSDWESGRLDTVDAALAADGSLGALLAELVRESRYAANRAPVIRLYRAMFLRSPDLAGLEFWMAKLGTGRSLTWVASAMAASAEFRNRYGALSDAGFVDQIYENVLGRAAEPAGKQYWTGVLASGQSRGKVVLHFSNSAENRANTADQVDVTNLFIDMLERVPSPSELADAIDEVQTTSLADFASGIITSEEYIDRIDALG